MELSQRRQWKDRRLWVLFPKPLAQSFAWDSLYLLKLLIVQDFILPQCLGFKVFVDLITPWVLINFVFRSPWRMLAIASFAVLLLETHSGLPRGLFACLYWVFGVSMFYLRNSISWTNLLPWAAVFFVAQVGVQILEGLSYWTQNFTSQFFSLHVMIRIFLSSLLSSIFGLFVIYKARLDTMEEHRLARR